jgi:type 1 glutamine amidotransferase
MQAACIAVLALTAVIVGQTPAQGVVAAPAVGVLRVLILSGAGDHDWQSTTPFLRRILADSGRFDVRVCESPAGLTHQTLADFDVVVDDYGGPALRSQTENAIARFVESGKGLVLTHGSLSSFDGNSARNRAGIAKIVPQSSQPSATNHTPVHFFDTKLTQTDHPIVRGMNSDWQVADAHYRGMTVPPGSEVIATARAEAGNARDGEPILVTLPFGRGRVFCTVLGHDLAAMQSKEFINTFARGTEWAATGGVTLPASLGVGRPDANAVKALLITGGHDHETSFYTLFDGYKDVAWVPVAASSTAFQSDLRGKFDVLIMYDFSRDLDEKGKKNLRDFAESGKGIVVLHHALLNYQKWPWWYQDVVGGSYRLAREGNVPSSTVKDGQQIFVTPANDEPITRGIGPFQIVDETYNRMWISPSVKPILTTDNPNSNHTIAWISPYANSRVVAIQLGHGHTAHGHPSYRTLVHNAILWAAGRIK